MSFPLGVASVLSSLYFTVDLVLIGFLISGPSVGHYAAAVKILTLVVTIPSEESRASVERSIRTAQELGVPLLGIVENMSGYACDTCGRTRPLFDGRAGAALAEAFGIPLLGSVPFHPMNDQRPQLELPAHVVDAVMASVMITQPAQVPSS